MIIFVGDKPSKKNIDPNIAFVGTKSYKTLLDWIYQMDIDITDVLMCNKDQVKRYRSHESFYFETPNMFLDYEQDNDFIIALGKKASKYLKDLGLEANYELPHPSGLNRKNNDKAALKKRLQLCKNLISLSNIQEEDMHDETTW